MPPVSTQLVEAMIEAGTARMDASERRTDRHESDLDNLRSNVKKVEGRVHDLEIVNAEARGASMFLPRILPLLTVTLSVIALLHSFGVF